MTEAADEHGMTAEQRELATAGAGARILVLAPAGTGKTEVVARRLENLIEGRGLAPSSDLLVLSFSRNAVAELRSRIRSAGPRFAAVPVSTIDSYAGRLLVRYAEPGQWETGDYEDRVRQARDVVLENPDARDEILQCRHLILDEIQDLVGTRAEFVDAVLQALDGSAGFTLLGDPAQGIYDFQIRDSGGGLDGREFLQTVFTREPKPSVRTLSRNFRTNDAQLLAIADLGTAIRDGALWGEGSDGHELKTALLQRHAYDLDATQAILNGLRDENMTGAVLCRYNSQALVVSRHLLDAGTAHVLQSASDIQTAAPWLAGLFHAYTHATISRSEVEARLGRIEIPHPDPDIVWRGLRRVEGRIGRDLSVRYVAAGVRTRRLPEELVDLPHGNVVVSSVHRAKGLEWDVVFLCGLTEFEEDDFDQVRLAYVAMTRAREELYVVEPPDSNGFKRKGQPDGRWVRRGFGSSRLLQLEVLADDVEWMRPAGTGLKQGGVEALQDYIATNVSAGDEVRLERVASFVEGKARAVYRIDHHGTAIGETTSKLSDALLFNADKSGGRPYPRALYGVRVQGMETVGGSTAWGVRSGLGHSGLWLRPRLGGLADLEWEGTS